MAVETFDSNHSATGEHWYSEHIDRVVVSQDDIQAKVKEMADNVSRELADADDDVILVGVFKGAVMFMADFARALSIPIKMEFMALSSYGDATTSSGTVRILKDIDSDIAGKHIIIVEDIVDSGLTLSWLMRYLEGHNPATVTVVSMLRKPGMQHTPIHIDHLGFDIPNEFVVGYGLDFAERYREMPFIGVLKPEIYQG